MYYYVEVEPNDNCPMSATQVFTTISEPVELSQVRVFDGVEGGRLCRVTGWSSEGAGTPSPAYGVRVTDSGSGSAWLVYGGDWGIRLQPAESAAHWSLDDADQWGETHLVLADAEDLITADSLA